MGGTLSKSRGYQDKAHHCEEFVVIPSASDWCLKFESRSYGICIGIDINSHNGGIQSLDDTAAKSATLVREAIAGNIIPCNRIHEYKSKPNCLCTKEVLRYLVIDTASKVQEGGNFIFQFSGSAFLHENEWVLAAADYEEDTSNCIIANDLMQWIVTAQCKAHHVLIILDCCCAGKIGEKLISKTLTSPCVRAKNQEVHVMCSCSTTHALPPVKILGGSIFSYFLSSNLKQQSHDASFNIKANMEKISELCHAFSALILNYTQEGDLMPVEVQPSMDSTLDHKLWKPVLRDETDHCTNLKVLFDLEDKSYELPPLHQEVIKWLKSAQVQKSLSTLHSKVALPTPLLEGVFCALLYSITCLHLKYGCTYVSKGNLFIVAAATVVLVLEESGHPKITVTKGHIKKGLEYYYMPLRLNGIPAKPIERLFDLL